ncbi:MAG TPA: serine hydrolase domain-containing protein [Kofleriaceae bacterium]|nr:serine hydrolase domain-containing protein [Kofleriaceae bacterium]
MPCWGVLNGDVAPGFEPVAHDFEKMLAHKRGGGAAVSVYHRGRCVVDLWGGVKDEAGAPWQRDTMAVSYSTTKGVVSTALHVLADRGLLDYDAPVARYWPEFAQAGKGRITVRDVLAHKAGLFNIRDIIDDARRMLDWDHMVEALAAATPAPVPAGATAYQALTYGFVVGELIRRVSGKPVSRFIADEIAGPLGLDGLYIGAPASELHRAARLVGSPARRTRSASGDRSFDADRRRRQRVFGYAERALRLLGHPVDFARAAAALAPHGISTFDFSSDEVLQACIPAANGLFTARSLARLYATLAAGGSLDGVKLMSPRTVACATEIQSQGYDQVTIFKMRWRLGYHRVGSLRGVPKRAFGHFGWGGSGAWGDPDRQLALGFIVNTGSGTPIGDLRILRLNTAALACARSARARQ